MKAEELMREKRSKPPLLAKQLLKITIPNSDSDFLLGDFEEIFRDKYLVEGAFSAYFWYWRQLFKTAPGFIKDTFYWRCTMGKNRNGSSRQPLS